MKAIRSHNRKAILDPDTPEPAPAPGEALVTPTRLAIDADDDAAATNTDRDFSGILGHEFVGVVEQVNLPTDDPLATRLTGVRVVGSSHAPCGTCERCRAGLSLHCPNATTLGLDQRDGCFAQRFTIPATSLVPIPDTLDDERAVFASSLGRVLHAAQMLRLEGKTYVSVLGDGPIALLAAQVMVKRNASVRLLGTHEANLELCTKWGVKHRQQHEVGRRQDQDIVFDCTGSDESVALAAALVRPRGSVVLMRARQHTATISAAAVIRDELHILGSRGCAIAEAVAELTADRVDVLSLIARRLRFEDAPQAMAAAREPGTLKILFDAA
ncbi:MAG: alcohol dehydrogenase catalytic domain-containing protein [Planctomycetota bacterium]|nr:alcohol dehydrogenase catalytic domain-containing protein [Planctomycetota bacterium]